MNNTSSFGRMSPWGKVVAYTVMTVFTILTIGPLFWLFYSSFKSNAAIERNPLSFPIHPTFENYPQAWELGHLGIYAVNSVIYAAVATTLTVLFALSAGYGFAKFRYRITNFFYFFFMIGLLVTVNSVIVPLFIMESKTGIGNTRFGVILPYIAFGLPLSIYLATTYVKGIPDSLEESARMDGAGYLRIFWNIIAPVSRPVVATMTILTFLNNWNEFILVFILTSKETLRSLPVGINSFAGALGANYGYQFAALVIGTIPMIVFYIFFHEEMARGFAEGALKE